MYEIEITGSQDFGDVDDDFLREVAQRTLAEEEVKSAIISIALVDNESIHQLNMQYLGHDYETDVLSFLLDCKSETSPTSGEINSTAATDQPQNVLPGKGKRIEGEVIISLEMAAQSASEYRWSPRDESVLYLVHGLLHLCGYDDLAEDELKIMRMRERAILKNWDLSPHYTDRETTDSHSSRETAESGGEP